jgi:hypothetical protein
VGCSRIPVSHNIESGAGIEPAVRQITGPLRPATIVEQGKPARIRTRTCEVGARCAPVTPRACASGRPGSNGPLRSGAPALFPLSYIRVEHARLDSNQRPLPSQSSALSAELRAYEGASGRS